MMEMKYNGTVEPVLQFVFRLTCNCGTEYIIWQYSRIYIYIYIACIHSRILLVYI